MTPFLSKAHDSELLNKYKNLPVKQLREKVRTLNQKLSKHDSLKTKKQLIIFLVSYDFYQSNNNEI